MDVGALLRTAASVSVSPSCGQLPSLSEAYGWGTEKNETHSLDQPTMG